MKIPFWKIGILTLAIMDSIFTYKLLSHDLIKYEEANPAIKYCINQFGLGPTMVIRLIWILLCILVLDFATKRSTRIKPAIAYGITFFLYIVIYVSFVKLR